MMSLEERRAVADKDEALRRELMETNIAGMRGMSARDDEAAKLRKQEAADVIAHRAAILDACARQEKLYERIALALEVLAGIS